jgi:Family of unknown function (DUF5678)
MIEQMSRDRWDSLLVDPFRAKHYRRRRRSDDVHQWKVDHNLPTFLRVLAECETGWRVMDIKSLFTPSLDEHDQAMFRLRAGATAGDERAMLGAAQMLSWQRLSAADFVHLIRQALESGAHKGARDLAKKGIKYHPNDPKIREYTHVLAPARVVSSSATSNGSQIRSNHEWLEAHGEEYSGQWVAIQDGELLGSSDSLETLVEKIGSTDDVLLTMP